MSDLGNKEIMGKNIQFYMDLYNKSRNDICHDLGIAYTTLTDWIKGNSYPRIDKIELMANYFGIEKSNLVERRNDDVSTVSKGISVPILNTVVAGMPIDAYEDILGYEEISRELASTGDFFALKVKGDSMLPVLQENDIIIVRQQSDVESGDIAIVLINGDTATVKKVMKQDSGITLIAFNPAVYEPHFYSNEDIESLPVKIAGKVVEMKRSF